MTKNYTVSPESGLWCGLDVASNPTSYPIVPEALKSGSNALFSTVSGFFFARREQPKNAQKSPKKPKKVTQ